MLHLRRHKQNGFSLAELALVLIVVGTIIGGIWTFAGSSRQSLRVEQSIEAISLIVDQTRAAYDGIATVSGGISAVTSKLVQLGALPVHLLRPVASACNGVAANYADTPWGGSASDPCGTLRVCAWTYSTNTNCGAPAASGASPFFAIEFTQLNYGSCVSLVESISGTAPSGLKDIYINGSSSLANGNGLPPTSAFAAANCAANSTIDVVYILRTPTT